MQLVQQTINVNTPAVVATAGVALAANAKRIYWQIQNIGVNPLYLAMGASTATASTCHAILAACATANDGTGGRYGSNEVCYQGVIAVGGTAPSYAVIELAP